MDKHYLAFLLVENSFISLGQDCCNHVMILSFALFFCSPLLFYLQTLFGNLSYNYLLEYLHAVKTYCTKGLFRLITDNTVDPPLKLQFEICLHIHLM